MKNPILFLAFIGLFLGKTKAFSQKNERFKSEVFSTFDSLKNIQYGQTVNLKEATEKLFLDVYSPNADTMKMRPLVVFLHGGGFKNGDKAQGYPLLFCAGLVKRGFVAASINYRLGVVEPQTDTTTYEAMYRAVQDGKAAVRFFRRYADKYGIDTNQIYIMGGSAGAIAALNLAYLDQNEVPSYINTAKLGNLEGTSGNGGFSSQINAVISCWGALSDLNLMKKGDIPIFSIHGMADKTVPYDSSFSSHGFRYGSLALNSRAASLGIPTGMKLFENTGHTLDSDKAKQNQGLDEACKWLFAIIEKKKIAAKAESVKRPKITGDAHIALFVSNIEKARAFYGDFLGFQEPYDLKNPDGTLSMTFFKVNENQYIEIFPTLKYGEDRLNHLAIETDNAEEMRLYLASKGVKVPEKVNKVRIGNTSFNIKDPDGHTVEFTQYEPSGWTRREKGKFLGNNPISKRMMHMGIIVSDAPKSKDFYENILGLKEFWRGNAKTSDVVSWINMRLPESEDYLEFMLYPEEPALDKRGGAHHICLEVPDIDKAFAEINAKPFRKNYTLPIEIRTGINRRRQINLFDPDGTRIELMEARTVDGTPPLSTTLSLPVKKMAIEQITAVLNKTVIENAELALTQKPITVTAQHSERSAGGLHDFFSEGDYWWQNPNDPTGSYIQRDGQSNPNNFTAHRKAMVRFSQIIGSLASAYRITKEEKYVKQAFLHLNAWFVDEKTRMNPSLLYAQAIKGKATGRGTGLIDMIQMMEVAQGIRVMENAKSVNQDDLKKVKNWFSQYLQWVTTHPYGIEERDAKNNHGTCWAMQVAVFAKLVDNQALIDSCKNRFKTILLPTQLEKDGSFPLELKRTKPYGYALFNLDAMATLCHVLSDSKDDLWVFTLKDGQNMNKAIEFMYPFVENKASWTYSKDVMYWDEWPVAQPFLLFGYQKYREASWLKTWTRLEHFPKVEEVIRNVPVRNPLIWLE